MFCKNPPALAVGETVEPVFGPVVEPDERKPPAGLGALLFRGPPV